MHKKLYYKWKNACKKAALTLVMSAMLMQSVTPVFAEEQIMPVTELAEETQVSAPALTAETEASVPTAETEKPTEAPTEKPTEAPTEAPTEKPTQTPAETVTEAQTEKTTEKTKVTEKTTEKKNEKKTKRSERINDGNKYSAAEIVSNLQSVLPYLFAADKIEAAEYAEKIKEEVKSAANEAAEPDTECLTAEDESEKVNTSEEQYLGNNKIKEDGSLTEGLKKFSKALANAQSAKNIQIINLYANKKGVLDIAQLDKAFKNQKLEVSDSQFVVINVIANDKSQNLTFSGYDMVKNGKPVEYKSENEKGYVLYNFAAMDGKKFTQYEGTLTLTDEKILQGTFLAPAAEVKIDADLAGAVYAKKIKVETSCEKLLHVVFCKGKKETVPETADLLKAETTVEENESETTEAVETEAAETEAAETEIIETEITETADSEESIEIESMTEIMTEISSEEMTEEDFNGEVLIDLAEYVDTVETVQWYTSESTGMQMKLDDLSNGEETALIDTVHVSLNAADEITDTDGKTVYEKDQQVYVWDTASEESLQIGDQLTEAGVYYLTVDGGDSYLDGSRIYLVFDDRGIAVLENSGWNKEEGLLTVAVYQAGSTIGRGLKLTVVDADDNTPITGAVFVIRDKDGNVICNSDGTPTWYINYEGTAVILDKLAAGEYIISQINAPEGYNVLPDQSVVIPEEGKELTLTNSKMEDTQKTAAVSARTYYEKTLLTSEKKQSTYAALFTEEEPRKRVSEVKELKWQPGSDAADTVVFDDLAADTEYYVVETNVYGDPLESTDYVSKLTDGMLQPDGSRKELSSVKTGAEGEAENLTAVLEQCYSNKIYPTDKYSYTAEILLKKIVKGTSGKAENTTDVFYLMLYKDAVYTQPLTETPIEISMNGLAELTQVYAVKMTQYEGTFYVKETDASGKDLPDNYPYAVSYTDGGVITVSCGMAAQATIENQLSSSVAMLGIRDAETGEYLPGVIMVLKNESGKVIGKFTSKASETKWTVPMYDTTYYLSAVQAPTGYAPAADMAFSIPKGQKVSVVMECRTAKQETTDYKVTVSKQVYCGGSQVYAYDTTTGSYAAKGAYTFYAALFADKERIQKVSDVQKITVAGLGGTTTFKNLKKGVTYYLAETNQYGQPLSSTASRSIKYSNSGKIEIEKKQQTAVIQNAYNELKGGYRYTGTMTINLRLLNAAGQSVRGTETFYVGIFRKADYSDKPTIVKMALNDADAVSVKRRILLSGEADMVYYIAEVDASGRRITDESNFGYKVTVDQPALTFSRGDDKVINITNQVKSSKVTLYLTKKVYEGVSPKKVNTTFYAGLFKDPEFKYAYTNPIPMNLTDKSELTLKLSLNLGKASEAKIYVAEVDADGKIVKSGKEFGYDVKVINSTVVFNEKSREVQSVLLNSVYSEATKENWQSIIDSEKNNLQGSHGNHNGNYNGNYDGSYGGDWYVSDNGEASPYDAGGINTGDETPILKYAWIMAAALLVMICTMVWILVRRKKR